MELAKQYNLISNTEMYEFSFKEINKLANNISNGVGQPNLNRLLLLLCMHIH